MRPDLKKHAHKWDEETKKTKKGFKGLPEKKTKKRTKSSAKASSKRKKK